MSKFTVLIILFWCFSGYLFASPLQGNSTSFASKKVASGGSPKPSRQASQIVSRAHELIGTPYRWGGASVSKGFDCSGLLVYLFRSEAGIHIPRTTSLMLNSKHKTVYRRDLKSGDLVFFKHNGSARLKHVGIYIGNNKFIHAPSTGKHVRIDSLNNNYWNKSYHTAKRFY